MKSRLVFLLVVFLCQGFLMADEAKIVVAQVTTVNQGKVVNLQWSAPSSKIASLPVWDFSAEKSPLSVDEAVKLASAHLSSKFPEVKEWKLDNAALVAVKNNGNSLAVLKASTTTSSI